jgi:hypothetical protein
VFSPDSFANLRSTFGIEEESYRTSIFGSGPFVSFQSNSKGAARAGGVFFFTRDGAYMIKTIKVRIGQLNGRHDLTTSNVSHVLLYPRYYRKKKLKPS